MALCALPLFHDILDFLNCIRIRAIISRAWYGANVLEFSGFKISK